MVPQGGTAPWPRGHVAISVDARADPRLCGAGHRSGESGARLILLLSPNPIIMTPSPGCTHLLRRGHGSLGPRL